MFLQGASEDIPCLTPGEGRSATHKKKSGEVTLVLKDILVSKPVNEITSLTLAPEQRLVVLSNSDEEMRECDYDILRLFPFSMLISVVVCKTTQYTTTQHRPTGAALPLPVQALPSLEASNSKSSEQSQSSYRI